MNIRLLIIGLTLACAAAAQGAVTQIPKMKTAPYEGWDFQVEVPQMSRRVALARAGDVELWDLYIYGDFCYFVKVVKTGANILTSTAIEQDIQAESNVATKRGATKRWEMDSREHQLLKGLNSFAKPDEDIPEPAAELRKVLRDRTAFVSAAWKPLSDESSPMLIVGVIGPKGRDGETENLARYFASGITKFKPGAAPPARAPKQPATPAKPMQVRTTTLTKPVKPVPALKKGEIQVVGVVESVALDGKVLTLTAQQIIMPESAPVKLDPPRRKVVRMKADAGIAVGDRVVVIGPNAGVGKAMDADFVDKLP